MSDGSFREGDRVRVLESVPGGNRRTPGYARGRTGTITARHGRIDNPLDHPGVYPPLYSVSFRLQELGGPAGHDRVTADIHEEWLDPI